MISREKHLSYKKKYRDKNKEKLNEQNKRFKGIYRQKFLSMYGNRCKCCGESIVEFLTIEHLETQRGKKKVTSSTAYRIAIKEYRPDLYEVLCYNCNLSKGRYGYCPHDKNS